MDNGLESAHVNTKLECENTNWFALHSCLHVVFNCESVLVCVRVSNQKGKVIHLELVT